MPDRVPAARLVFGPEDRRRILGMVDAALESGSLTLGRYTREFEDAFAGAHDAKHAVATSSGTSALEIILRTISVDGREVVVPANTFFATAAAVLHAGGRVRLADVDAGTFALTTDSVEAVLTTETAVVVVVHIGGLISADVPSIRRLCDSRGVLLVEDAAHAHGSRLDGAAAGSFGHAAAFSFYPTKVIASAEGGMIVTADDGLAQEARIYRDQGKASFSGGGHVRLGSAWRMSELNAAVGMVHLEHLEEFLEVRRRAAERYDRALSGVSGLHGPQVPHGSRPNYYKYPVMLPAAVERSRVKERLQEEFGVVCSGEVYATPLHAEPVFASSPDVRAAPLPVAEEVCARHVCLPVHSDMTAEEADYVVESFCRVVAAESGRDSLAS